MVRPWRGVLA